MADYLLYDPATGKVVSHVSGAYDDPANWKPAELEAFLLSAYQMSLHNHERDFYILGGVLEPRPGMPVSVDKTDITADDVDVATISGVPAGASVGDGVESVVADGSDIQFSTDIEGTHEIVIEKFPFKPYTVVINAI